MQLLTYARLRIEGVLAEIARLKDLDFPYSHSQHGLGLIEGVFLERKATLRDLSADNEASVVKAACEESLLQILRYLPLLGFILRSTDTRNSFEIFGPLLRMARQILGSDTKLVVSSEWVYSPHVYNPFPALPNFVLLGLPASESCNPLLVPVAGHELGHTTWQSRKLYDLFGPLIEKEINRLVELRAAKYTELFGGDLSDLFVAQNLAPAHYVAMRQAEETFCDLLGLKIFSESYLYAFAYLMTPKMGDRSEHYPSLELRVAEMLTACAKFGVNPPTDYASWFAKELEPARSDKDAFLLKLADDARLSIVDQLIDCAQDIAFGASAPTRSEAKIDAVVKSFRMSTPVEKIGDLVNILNAAWKYFEMTVGPCAPGGDAISMLNELVLKSIEIVEFEQRVKGAP